MQDTNSVVSIFSVHQNHLGDLLKHRLLCSITQNFSCSRAKMWALRLCISNKFPGYADVVSPGNDCENDCTNGIDLLYLLLLQGAWPTLWADSRKCSCWKHRFNLQVWAENVGGGTLRSQVSKPGCQEEFGFVKIRRKHRQNMRVKVRNAEPSKAQVLNDHSCSPIRFAFCVAFDNRRRKEFVIQSKCWTMRNNGTALK